MKSEEKLNQLFEILKKENTTTSVSEITSWIEANTSIAKAKTVKPFNYSKIIIISSIITTTLIVAVILVSKKRASIEDNKILSLTKEFRITTPTDSIYSTDSPKNKKIEYIQDEIAFSKTKATSNTPINKIKRDTIVKNEIQYPFDLSKHSKNDINETYPQNNIEKATGIWRSLNDRLKVDTLFNGVKSLVFKGDKSDILISGSNRADISMKYNYQLKAKGVFSRKKEGNCELSYVLKDSVLTIHLQRKDQNFNGVSVLSESSKIEFYVPENVDVKMDSDLGDIDADGLKNKNTILRTALGDISAKNTSGTLDLKTDLGDIIFSNLSGKISCFTSLGDVSGENLTVKDDCKLESSLGDIDVQLSNPLSELRLDLSTSLGKVKVDRPELMKKAGSQLTFGNGKFKIVMETALGKVIVR